MHLTHKEIARRLTFRRRAAVLIAAASLAALWLGVAKWDDERPVPVAQADKPVPPPPVSSWQLATAPAKAWDPNAARNAPDLYAAFKQAKDSKRPDAWMAAADIAGLCHANAISPAPRNRLPQERGEWNSTKADQPERDAELAELKQREVALAELEQRCKGFRGTDSKSISAITSELRAKAERSDSDVGRLMRARAALREGGDAREWVSATTAALASGNPVLTRMALYGMTQLLFDERGPPAEAPKFSAFGALLTAHARVAGEDFDRNDMELLAVCAIGGPCEGPDPKTLPPAAWSAKGQARWEDVVGQYEKALRANDVKAILAVAPTK